ncbi:MAG: carboxypeptidase-like regulatory domain-containing protein, partial [Saprospiraceae bacterium]|nr:carboxypeptidase-like regulatory domain-containing protein [Saprospiraceae bacterium]
MKSTANSFTRCLRACLLMLLGLYCLPNVSASAAEAAFYGPVKGVVLSNDGEPLIGVTVLLQGTTQGTATDFDGSFTIDVPDNMGTLVFSYTGYETLEIAVEGRSELSIAMSPAATALDEVVVIGYGSQKKVNLTGAVSSITSEALENRPIASVGQGLQGLVPNMNVTIRNGDPTQSANFNIR